jgi:hypothetical protein
VFFFKFEAQKLGILLEDKRCSIPHKRELIMSQVGRVKIRLTISQDRKKEEKAEDGWEEGVRKKK